MKIRLAVLSVFMVSVLNVSGQCQFSTTGSTSITTPCTNVAVGASTADPTFILELVKNANSATVAKIKNTNNGSSSLAGLNFANDTANTYGMAARGSNNNYGALTGGPLYFYTNSTAGLVFMVDNAGPIKFATGGNVETARFDGNGNLGLGRTPAADKKLDVNGNVNVTGDISMTGNINAKYQDVAEWVPFEGYLPAGSVVVLSRGKTNTVTASMNAYDTAVAGVVSDQPGVLLGVAASNKSKIATTGRVKVHVDASKHPVAIGDLLVTSDRPGMAMRSEPLDLGGVKIHRPGTLIGKALEPLAAGEGEILVLLSLQ